MEYKSKRLNIEITDNDKRIEVYYKLIKLKNLFRQGWLKKGIDKTQCESVADHSFGSSILAMLLAPEGLDREKLVMLMLIHEAGEALIGDIIPQDNISSEEKRQRERNAVSSIFSDLKDAGYYLELWEEFETGTSKEARFARDLDKFEMALQASFYSKANAIDLKDFLNSAKSIIQDKELQKKLVELK